MTTLAPKVAVLPAAQRALWPELKQVPRSFVLYGGTAIALRLGHRASVDFDFFAHDPLDQRVLERSLSFVRSGETLQEEPNARTVLASTPHGPVKVSFFGAITFGRVGEPSTTDDDTIRVASLLDLAGTKIKVLLQRVEAKDYLDVVALLRAGCTLEQILGAARALFGGAFNPLVARKTLAYFEGGDLARLPADAKRMLIASAIHDVDVEPLPKASDRID